MQKIKVTVIEARYLKKADSILMVVENSGKRFYTQINSSAFTIKEGKKEEEMEKLAEMLIGKSINYVCDKEIEDKIKDKFPIKY